MSAQSDPNVHHILSIDPGVTTGICRGLLNTEKSTLTLTPDQKELSLGQFYELVRSSASLVMPHVHIIYETFEYRNVARTGLNLTPVKLIGVIELLAEWYSDESVTFYGQSASTGKAFFRNDKLKTMGVYVPAKPHGMDAMRHLLHWLAFREGSQYADTMKLDIKLGGA